MISTASKFTFALAGTLAAASLTGALLFANVPVVDNSPPVFIQPVNCNDTYHLVPGQQLCVNIEAADADQDPILLIWNNVPFVGSSTTPPCPLQSQPGQNASTTFCYTPSATDVGQTYIVVFDAKDPAGEDAKCDLTIVVESSLSAEISSFTGASLFTGGPVMLNWSTSSEVDNAYFNVFRSQGGLDTAVQINKQPIIALGSPSVGADYGFADHRVMTGNVYKYWIESIDIYGSNQFFGPIAVVAR